MWLVRLHVGYRPDLESRHDQHKQADVALVPQVHQDRAAGQGLEPGEDRSPQPHLTTATTRATTSDRMAPTTLK